MKVKIDEKDKLLLQLELEKGKTLSLEAAVLQEKLKGHTAYINQLINKLKDKYVPDDIEDAIINVVEGTFEYELRTTALEEPEQDVS